MVDRRNRAGRRPARVVALLTLLLGAGVATDVLAASGEPAAGQAGGAVRRQPSQPDFLFGRPRTTLGLRGGRLFARAESDLYSFVSERLTLERRDFDAPQFVAELGVALTSRLDVVGGIEFARARADSEYRDFVDNNRLPIEQQTSLSTVNLAVSLRAALTPRGRAIGQLAWIPAAITPYVGAGGGLMRYNFEQSGDFVDFVDFSIFADAFQSSGWVPSAHVLGGVDVRLFRTLYLSTEGRYVWASGELSQDFVGFDPIDLAGFRLTGGINVLF